MENNECARIREELWELDSQDPQHAETLRAHLRDCPECAAEYERIMACKAGLREQAVSVPGELRERVMTSVCATPQQKKHLFIPVGTIAAALLVLALFGVSRLGEISRSTENAYDSATGIETPYLEQTAGEALTDASEPKETHAPQLSPDWFASLAQFSASESVGEHTDDGSVVFSPDRVTTLYVVQGGNAAEIAVLLPEGTLRLESDGDVLFLPPSAQVLTHDMTDGWWKFTRTVYSAPDADGVAILVTAP